MHSALSKAVVCALAALLAGGCLESGQVTGPGVGDDDDDAPAAPDASLPTNDPPDASEASPADASEDPPADASEDPPPPDPPDASVPPPPPPDANVPSPPDANVPSPPDATVPPPPPPDASLPPPTGPDCTNAASWPAEWVAFEDQVLVLVNQKRAAGATCGGVAKPPVGPLVMDARLRQAARCHSMDMAKNNYFSHDSQDGRSPWTRISQAGYTASPTSENIAAGQATPASVMSSWMTSTGHCNNIMGASSNEIGVGYAVDTSSDFDRYWTQDFGRR